MAGDIKVGSVVRLASGGPAMTVNKFMDDGDAYCSWFDDKKNLQHNRFPTATLVLDPMGGGGAIYT